MIIKTFDYIFVYLTQHPLLIKWKKKKIYTYMNSKYKLIPKDTK